MTLREQAVVFKALGHPARLAVVRRLGRGECCVCELLDGCDLGGIGGPAVSQHLHVLKNAGVIEDERRGQRVYYRLSIPCVAEISVCMAKTSKRAREVGA